MRKKILRFVMALWLAMSLTACGEGKTTDSQSEKTATISESGQGSTTDRNIVLTQNTEYPDYYEEEVKKTIQSVRDNYTGESVSYLFITDLHLDENEETETAAFRQLNAVVDVANNTDIDFVCVGGDLYNGRYGGENGKQTAMGIIESVSQVLEKCNKPVFILKGNHDDNSFSAQENPELLYDADYIINREEWYSVTMAHFSQYAQGYQNGYFYYDLPGKNTRVICLNMSDSDDTVVDGKQNEMGMYFYGYKDEQMEWLLNTAMSREDCQYMILCHDAFSYPQGYGEGSNRDTLRDILTAAYNHTMYQGTTFEKDFSQWGGNLILYSCGHMHMSRFYIDEEMGGFPILNTEISKYYPNRKLGEKWREMGYSSYEGRQKDTISEALFDVVISKEKQIQIIRFGAGEDRTVTY